MWRVSGICTFSKVDLEIRVLEVVLDHAADGELGVAIADGHEHGLHVASFRVLGSRRFSERGGHELQPCVNAGFENAVVAHEAGVDHADHHHAVEQDHQRRRVVRYVAHRAAHAPSSSPPCMRARPRRSRR
jgi:hypothetical protein